jgi:hypothetical protein
MLRARLLDTSSVEAFARSVGPAAMRKMRTNEGMLFSIATVVLFFLDLVLRFMLGYSVLLRLLLGGQGVTSGLFLFWVRRNVTFHADDVGPKPVEHVYALGVCFGLLWAAELFLFSALMAHARDGGRLSAGRPYLRPLACAASLSVC